MDAHLRLTLPSPPRQALSVFFLFPRPPDSPGPWAPVSRGRRTSPCLPAPLHSAFPIQAPTVSHSPGDKDSNSYCRCAPILTSRRTLPPAHGSRPHWLPFICSRELLRPECPAFSSLPPALPRDVLSGDSCAPPGNRPLPHLLPAHCSGSRIRVAQYTSP